MSLVGSLLVAVPPVASQAPSEISGSAWRDINADGVRDADEPAFVDVPVELIDVNTGVIVGPINTDATGNYTFSSVADGDYQVRVVAPLNYWVSPATTDNDFTPIGAGGTPDRTGRSGTITIAAGTTVAGLDVAVRPRPEVTLGLFGPGVIDGSSPYNVSGNCTTPVATPTPTGADEWSDTTTPGQNPGDDCGSSNGIVRTMDSLASVWSVTADNYAPGAGDLDSVIFEQVIHPSANAVVDFERIPVSCLAPPSGTGGASPVSSITYDDPAPGDIKLTCNLGAFTEGFQESLTTFIVPSGESWNGSTFTTSQRVYSVDTDGNNNAVPDAAEELGPIEISAAPAYDADKDNIGILNYGPRRLDMTFDDHLPDCPAGAPSNTCNIGPETGMYGYFLISLSSERDSGIESLQLPLVFDDDFTATTDTPAAGTPYAFEFEIYHCQRNTSGWSNSVYGTHISDSNHRWYGASVDNSGTCTYDRADPTDPTSEVTFEVDNIDFSGDNYPTETYGGADLSAGPFYVMMHRVAFFIPNRTLDLADGVEDGVGSISVSNCIDNFDPDSPSGVSNFGDEFEPGYNRTAMPNGTGSNNCAGPTTFELRTRGSFSKYNYGYVGSNGYPYQNDGNSSHAGASTREPGDTFVGVVWNRNNGSENLFDPVACDVFDNTTLRITTAETVGASGWTPTYLPAGSYAYINNGYTWNSQNDPDDFVVEYASADFGSDDPIIDGFNATTGRYEGDWSIARQFRCDDNATVTDGADTYTLATPTGGDPEGDGWTTDPTAFANGIDDVNMVRGRLAAPDIAFMPPDDLPLFVPLEIRNTFNGGPYAGDLIPGGTVMPNFGSARWANYAAGDWTDRNYLPSPETTHVDGDRVTLTRAELRLSKRTVSPATDVGDSAAILAGNQIVWELLPTLTSGADVPTVVEDVVVVDVLPEEATYNASCTLALADGTVPSLIEPDTPNAGETRLTWFLGARQPNTAIDTLIFCTDTDSLAPNGTAVVNYAEVTGEGVVMDTKAQSDDHTIVLEQAGSIQLSKDVDIRLDDRNDDQIYTLAWSNLAPSFTIAEPVVIDVFSYDDDSGNNHDGTGSLSERDPESNFSGAFYLTGEPVVTWTDGSTPTAADASATIGTWWYTNDDPWTIQGDPDQNTSNWCVEADFGTAGCPADFTEATAIKFISNYRLDRDGSVRQGMEATYTMQAGDPSATPDPLLQNAAGDVYTNRFSLDTTSLEADQYLRSNNVTVQVAAFSIGDMVFADANGNGIYDLGVDTPAPDGVLVELRTSAGALVDSMETDGAELGAGRYLFTQLEAGDYRVVLPASNFSGVGAPLLGWLPTIIPASSTPNDDLNENEDQHGYTLGTVAANGLITDLITLSAQPAPAGGYPSGDEPIGDNTGSLPDTTNDDFSNLTLDVGLIPPAAVEIQKQICTEDPISDCDIDDASHWVEVQQIPYGDTARWRIEVTNTGGQILSDVTIGDTVESACARDQATIADLATMAPDDVVAWTCDTTDVVQSITNTAEVTATPVIGADLTDDDPAQVTVPPAGAGIDIEKATNTHDADTAPGVMVEVGGSVTWTYVVTNTGNIPLENVAMTDDMGTATTADDVTMTTASAGFVGGDTDGDDRLDLTETWTFTASGTGTTGQYTNLADVTGLPIYPLATAVTDEDPSNYFGFETPSIDIEKATNAADPTAPTAADDADSPTGKFILAGDDVEWTYLVQLDGSNAPVANVVVVDDFGTADPADDVTLVLQGGDDGDGLLEEGEVWEYSMSGTAIAGQYGNIATVTGRGPEAVPPGGGIVLGAAVTDNDPSHYFGVETDIAIEKATNGVDADTAPGPFVLEDGAVTWTYVVTNSGNTDLGSVTVTDDLVDATDINCGVGTNVIDVLAVGDSHTCTATGSAEAGQYANVGSVVGTPIDSDGDTIVGITEPTDSDPSHYFGASASVTIEKATNALDPDLPTAAEDADETPGPYVPENGAVTWTYVVTNDGNTDLESVTVTDDQLAPSAIDCDLGSNVIALLEPGESHTCTATGIAVTGQYANLGAVTGTPVDGNGDLIPGLDPVTDDDPSHYYGVPTTTGPSIDITKYVEGYDANDAPGPQLIVGNVVNWTYVVANTGDTALMDIELTDDQGVAVSCPQTELAVAETMTCIGEGVVTVGAYVNIGTVVGQPAWDDPADPGTLIPLIDPATGEIRPTVDDDDPANHHGEVADYTLIKEVCIYESLEDCNADDDAWVKIAPAADGNDVNWRITLINLGTVDLTDVTVTDTVEGACERVIDVLAAGETVHYTCTTVDVDSPLVNIADVTAVPPCELPVGDERCSAIPPTDPKPKAEVVPPPPVGLTKTVDDDTVSTGQIATYTVTLENVGTITAYDVEVVDYLPDGLEWKQLLTAGTGNAAYDESANTITWTLDELEPGEIQALEYETTVLGTGGLVNTARVTSEQGGLVTQAVETATRGRVPSRLAFTGGSASGLSAFGLLLLAFGSTMVFGTRRRRDTETA